MTNKTNSILAVGILIVVSMACNFSFSTAKLGDLKFAKDKDGNGANTTFNPNDEIFAVTSINNAIDKNKIKFRLLFDNVPGAPSGAVAYKLEKEGEIEGSRPIWFNFSVPGGFVPGTYKVEAVISGENGKELDRKIGTLTIKGDAPANAVKPPAPPADSKHSDDSDKDDDN